MPSSEFFSVDEISKRWKLSRDFVRRIFEREDGVLRLPSKSRPGKRAYVTLRVPASVLLRVERRNSVGGQFTAKEI